MKLNTLWILVFSIVSCHQQQKFEKAAWAERGDLGQFSNRKVMLDDLLDNHKLEGLSYAQLTDLLGVPENYSNAAPNTAYYNIEEEFGSDLDPIYVKNLEVKFSVDSIVSQVAITEIEH